MTTQNRPHTSAVHGDAVHREWSRFKYPQSLIKYGILPQHLQESELTGGNGLVELGTFLAILLGTIAGTVSA